MLDQADETPFLGNIEPGSAVQGMDCTLFKSPIHKHAPSTTDFLLVKYVSKYGQQNSHYYFLGVSLYDSQIRSLKNNSLRTTRNWRVH